MFDFNLQVRTKINPTKWPITEPVGKTFLQGPGPGQGPPGLPFRVATIPPAPHISSFKPFPFPSAPPLSAIEPQLQNGNVEKGSDTFHLNENLNPDVPEFIPVTVRLKGETSENNVGEKEKTEEVEKKAKPQKPAQEGNDDILIS